VPPLELVPACVFLSCVWSYVDGCVTTLFGESLPLCCTPAGLLGHGVLGLVEVAKASLAAEGVQIVPASATLYCMGIELQIVDSWELLPGHTTASSQLQAQDQQEQEQQERGQQGLSAEAVSKVEVCLRALQPYRYETAMAVCLSLCLSLCCRFWTSLIPVECSCGCNVWQSACGVHVHRLGIRCQANSYRSKQDTSTLTLQHCCHCPLDVAVAIAALTYRLSQVECRARCSAAPSAAPQAAHGPHKAGRL